MTSISGCLTLAMISYKSLVKIDNTIFMCEEVYKLYCKGIITADELANTKYWISKRLYPFATLTGWLEENKRKHNAVAKIRFWHKEIRQLKAEGK